MVRKDLESKLDNKVSEDLIQLQSMNNQQGEMLESQLSAVWEQQEQTGELLEGGLATFMASKGATGICSAYNNIQSPDIFWSILVLVRSKYI